MTCAYKGEMINKAFRRPKDTTEGNGDGKMHGGYISFKNSLNLTTSDPISVLFKNRQRVYKNTTE